MQMSGVSSGAVVAAVAAVDAGEASRLLWCEVDSNKGSTGWHLMSLSWNL